MPKFACKCGFVFDLIETPSPYDLSLIPEVSIEKGGDYLLNGGVSQEELFQILDEKSRSVYECPRCNRIHLETDVGSAVFQSFVKEVGTN